jgi:hypothetical protein
MCVLMNCRFGHALRFFDASSLRLQPKRARAQRGVTRRRWPPVPSIISTVRGQLKATQGQWAATCSQRVHPPLGRDAEPSEHTLSPSSRRRAVQLLELTVQSNGPHTFPIQKRTAGAVAARPETNDRCGSNSEKADINLCSWPVAFARQPSSLSLSSKQSPSLVLSLLSRSPWFSVPWFRSVAASFRRNPFPGTLSAGPYPPGGAGWNVKGSADVRKTSTSAITQAPRLSSGTDTKSETYDPLLHVPNALKADITDNALPTRHHILSVPASRSTCQSLRPAL